MKKVVSLVASLTLVAGATWLAGCSSQSGSHSNLSPYGTLGSTTLQGSELTVRIAPELDREGSYQIMSVRVMKEGFKKVELLNGKGEVVKTATLPNNETAKFDLNGLGSDDYFLRFNDNAGALVPTRIVDPAQPITQHVGRKLIHSVIGDIKDPSFKFKVYNNDLGGKVVKYSDGTTIEGKNAYFVTFHKTAVPGYEVRVLGTGERLGYKLGTSSKHWKEYFNHDGATYDEWILGDNNHGKISLKDAGTSAGCFSCHTEPTEAKPKPTNWSLISRSSGSCYACHYGSAGDRKGLVDPTL
jgi:hypothetical protein